MARRRERDFRAEVPGLEVRTNRAVRFNGFSSSTRIQDSVGDVVPVSDEETALPVLVTALNYGKGAKQESIQVDLEAELTAVDTVLSHVAQGLPLIVEMEFAVEEVMGVRRLTIGKLSSWIPTWKLREKKFRGRFAERQSPRV